MSSLPALVLVEILRFLQLGNLEISLAYWFVAVFCAVSGGVLCALFASSTRLRERRGARLAGALGVLSGIALYLVVLPEAEPLTGLVVSALSIVALGGYAATGIYLAVRATFDAARTLSTRLPGTGRAGGSSALLRPSLAGYQRLLSERIHELKTRPTDPRLRKELFEILLELGDYEGAIYHAYALIEMLPPGPAHGLALYRLSQTLVERLNQLAEAQPHLKRIIRLYPRSFFASYARRLVNQFEAYADREL